MQQAGTRSSQGRHYRNPFPEHVLCGRNQYDAPASAVFQRAVYRHPPPRILENYSKGDVENTLTLLEMSGKAQVVIRNGVRYWSAISSHYPNLINTKIKK